MILTPPVWSTTKIRSASPGGDVTHTGRSVVPSFVSTAEPDTVTGGGTAGCETARVPTENVPFMPRRAWPGTLHR